MYQKKQLCTIFLVVINVIIFFSLVFQGMPEDPVFMLEHGAMYLPKVLGEGEYYRLLTSMFLHFDFQHLMNNMIMLGVLGWQLEQELGKFKYLVLYFLSGLGGNLLSAVVEIETGNIAVSAGASGAIFGVIGALLFIALRNHGRVGELSGRGIVFMIFLSLYFGFTSTGVDNMAHIGGLICGFVLSALLYRKKRIHLSRNFMEDDVFYN